MLKKYARLPKPLPTPSQPNSLKLPVFIPTSIFHRWFGSSLPSLCLGGCDITWFGFHNYLLLLCFVVCRQW